MGSASACDAWYDGVNRIGANSHPTDDMAPEVEAFLQRIRAFPDDDAPRLIFADWLEEHAAAAERFGSPASREWNEARGRFIRIQIALAQLQPDVDDDALTRPSNDKMEMMGEEQRLENAYKADWIAPLHGLALDPRFRRGFVEDIQIEARVLMRHAGEVFDASPIRRIRLIDVSDGLPEVFACPYLSRINDLKIHASYVGEPLARALARSKHLSGLRTLHLFRNRFEDEGVRHLATSPMFANLEDLDLGDNGLTETSAHVLASSPHLSRIKRLELRLNRLGPVGAEAIAGSERLPELIRVGLAENEIGAARIHTLTRSDGFFRVPILDLSSNELHASALQIIFHRAAGGVDPATSRLRDLDLSNNPLLDNGVRVIAACERLANLRSLRLAGCQIGDEGLRALTVRPYLSNLVKLDLSNNPIGDAGCRALLEANYLPNLRRPIVPGIGISLAMHKRLAERYPER